MEKGKFIEIFKEYLTSFLDSQGYKNFIAGSKRFGYDSETSDLDIIVYAENNYKHDSLLSFFIENGFIRAGSSYGENVSSVWSLGNKIHINVFNNEKEYENLREEHLAVEKVLKKNPILIKFIKEIKLYAPIKGSFIYRSLINCFSDEEIKISA